MADQTTVEPRPPHQKTKPWFFLIAGIPALVRGWAQWGKEPRPVWAYLSLASGLVLVTLFVMMVRANRRTER
jgi:hypothetical protein